MIAQGKYSTKPVLPCGLAYSVPRQHMSSCKPIQLVQYDLVSATLRRNKIFKNWSKLLIILRQTYKHGGDGRVSFTQLDIKQEYRSLLDNVIKGFYIPVLKEATLYKRAVGFFSSTALVEMSAGICGLVKNGGKIQLIASPRLSAEDIEAINEGIKRRDDVIEEALIRELSEPIGAHASARLNLLSNLIASGVLEIKIAFLEEDNSVGMFHEKMGLMYDQDNNIIAFSGSMNESYNAFRKNYEAIDVFTSWSNDEERVLTKQSAFNAMWNDYEPNIRVREFPQVSELIVSKYRISDETDLSLDDSFADNCSDNLLPNDKRNSFTGPHIPANVKMRPYQIEAINNWAENNYRGIFDMATGTGKTYTALAAITALYVATKQNLAVFIVCPYQHLVEQWKDDIIAFGMKPIICYSASAQKNWKERLKTAATSFNLGVQNHFCVVATNAILFRRICSEHRQENARQCRSCSR